MHPCFKASTAIALPIPLDPPKQIILIKYTKHFTKINIKLNTCNKNMFSLKITSSRLWYLKINSNK